MSNAAILSFNCSMFRPPIAGTTLCTPRSAAFRRTEAIAMATTDLVPCSTATCAKASLISNLTTTAERPECLTSLFPLFDFLGDLELACPQDLPGTDRHVKSPSHGYNLALQIAH